MKSIRNIKNILVTGGAGFIGSAFIRYVLQNQDFEGKIINFDLLTYAANLDNLKMVEKDLRYFFIKGNICDSSLVKNICEKYKIDTIVHFAAETHVDRSISGPKPFLETNIFGTFSLLEIVKKYPQIHFHHISTDEVYGALELEDKPFCENSQYRPNSPYSAAKAASDHFVRAYNKTYGISTTISHCSNNYGPCQHEEKLIPLMIKHCLLGKKLPVYGKGHNVRDWLYVDDHAEAIWMILNLGKSGHVYDIGGDCEYRNIDLLHILFDLLSKHTGEKKSKYSSLINYVTDRLGHDYRYAIDFSKLRNEINWNPKHSIEKGLKKTINWYL
jgi:dTDP-glucose 4,6-dehydratase